jgi:hypothetical protein
MNLITNTWRQLIRRRLWPVALLLVAALVAVPLKLAKTPAAAAPVPAPALAKAAQAEASSKPVVQLRTASEGKARRRVLGRVKDPFEPAPLPKAKKKKQAKAAATATPTATATPAGGGGGSGSGGGGGTSAPPSSEPTTPAVPTVTFPKGALKVRFGDANSTSELPTLYLNRLEPLPDADAPVLVYEGARDGGKSAVFSIPGEIVAVGDGHCDPKPDDCATLKLRAGQTEFITVKGGGPNGEDVEYQLDLLKIYDKATKVPASEATPSAPGGGA